MLLGFRTSSIKSFIIGCSLLLTCCSVHGEGHSYHIATNGSDHGRGSLDSPWASLQRALTVAGPGDTVFIHGGFYEADEVWLRGDRGIGGAAGRYLTIKNYRKEIPVIGGSRRMIIDAVHFLRIEGLHFQLPYRISGGGNGFQVVNNTFTGPQPTYGAIEFFADNGLIEGNRIEISGGGDTKDHAIYLHAGHDNVIRNNFISGSSGYGVHIYDASSSGGSRASVGYKNIWIEGNIILGSRMRAGIIISKGEGVPIGQIVIRRNTIAHNAINAIQIRSDAHDVTIYNNTLYDNGRRADNDDDQSAISLRSDRISAVSIKNNIIHMPGSRGYHIQNRDGARDVQVQNNLYCGRSPRLKGVKDSYPVEGTPHFVDADKDNFHLAKSSPAVDAGQDIGQPFKGSAPDLGAFEYGAK